MSGFVTESGPTFSESPAVSDVLRIQKPYTFSNVICAPKISYGDEASNRCKS